MDKFKFTYIKNEKKKTPKKSKKPIKRNKCVTWFTDEKNK